MKEHGADMQVICTIPVMFSYWAKPEHCLEVSRFLNDDIAKVIADDGDHFAGLPFLLLDAQFTRRVRPLVIAGPQGIETKLANLMEALFEHSSKTKQRFDLSVVALEPEQSRTFGEVKVTPYPVVHGESGGPFLTILS